jgi:hypothetical protein
MLHHLWDRRLGLSAEIADLEEQVSKWKTTMSAAETRGQKAEFERHFREAQKELGFLMLGEINRELVYLRSGGTVVSTEIAREAEDALTKLEAKLYQAESRYLSP